MKKAIIICAAGMSSSLMAKKTTDYLQGQGEDITMDATTVMEGGKVIRSKQYDLYLISPQARMKFDEFERICKEEGMRIALIPFEAYVPIPMGIEKLGKFVLSHIND